MKDIKKKIKNEILFGIGNMSNFFIDFLSKAVDLSFISFEVGQKIIYKQKTNKFWLSGNLYKLKQNRDPDFLHDLFEFSSNPPQLLNYFDVKIFADKKQLDKFIFSNRPGNTYLKNDEYFLILQINQFDFDFCVLQILVKDKIYIIILNKDQSKKPWKYFEHENSQH